MPVVDASLVVDWVAPGADPDGAALRALERLRDSVLSAPRLLREEVAHALLTGIRRDRWTGREADEAFGLLGTLPISVADEPRDLDRAWDLSRRYDAHPVHDMLYVALALRTGQQLVTADDSLRRRVNLPGVVVSPDDL